MHTVASSRTRHPIQAQEGDDVTVTVTGTLVGADVQVTKDTGPIELPDNRVGNNLSAAESRGGIDITGNTIRVNLFCQDNQPAPTGGGNVVRGDAQGQCEGLDT